MGDLHSQTYGVVNLIVKLGHKFIRIQAQVLDQLPRNLTVQGLTKDTNHL